MYNLFINLIIVLFLIFWEVDFFVFLRYKEKYINESMFYWLDIKLRRIDDIEEKDDFVNINDS